MLDRAKGFAADKSNISGLSYLSEADGIFTAWADMSPYLMRLIYANNANMLIIRYL